GQGATPLSTAAAIENLLVLQAGGAPADRLEGVKPLACGRFLLLHPAPEGRTICLRRDISCGYDISLRDVICSALRNVKERIRRGGFFSILLYFALGLAWAEEFRTGADCPPCPSRKREGIFWTSILSDN
ncbi:MAG: hypothetical protein IKK01_06930, partial [Clostridia bacterium]|nr:hypothetical protein [Clostridia bacterium]